MSRLRPVFAAFALLVACTPTEPRIAVETSVDEPARAGEESVRIKGLAPRLLIHRQRGGRIEELHDGAMARRGDLVQISYVAAGNRSGVVVSLDGRGVVTLHHPLRPDASPAIVARGQHALNHAYELDDARSFERFVFVTSGDGTLTPQVVLAAARSLAQRGSIARHSPLPLPPRWQQSSLTLHKRP